MKRINIYITKKQFDLLKQLNGLSLSEHIRRAIDEYLARLRKEHNEQYNQSKSQD